MSSQINILMLGGAKRVSMARLFRKAADVREIKLSLFSYELSEYVPIASEAKVINGLRWHDPAVIEDIGSIVEREHINIVIPFVDPSIALAARLREKIPELYVPTGSITDAEIMLDKIAADREFRNVGIAVPATLDDGAVLPLIAKPRYGSASKGIVVLRDVSDLERYKSVYDAKHEYIIQEYIADREEYTVDCFVDSRGVITACQPRIRLATAGGEVTDTVTVDDSELIMASRNALTALGLRGAVTVQWLRDLTDGRLMLMEINPRLGGGAVVSVYAGSDLPGMILDDALLGDAGNPVQAIPGVRMARYMQEVIFKSRR